MNMRTLRSRIDRLWTASRPLTAVGLGMLVVFVLSLIGLAVDSRIITGAPAWLKPAKFAISTAIYALTVAWIFTYLEAWPRLKRVVGWTTAIVLVLEVGLIDMQAARGITSHFNVATPFDATVFVVMGTAILAVWVAAIALTIAVFRQHFADESFGWAIRLGLLVTVLGQATGGLMTQPTSAQMASARAGERMTISGAHTVGAPDGGTGLPGTGWSTTHGDIRVAHFIGLHAVQIVPVIALLLQGVPPIARRRLVFVAGTSYASFFGILLWQALRGQALIAPDGLTIEALTAWLIATAIGIIVARSSNSRTSSLARKVMVSL
jgi:hypothetical protein